MPKRYGGLGVGGPFIEIIERAFDSINPSVDPSVHLAGPAFATQVGVDEVERASNIASRCLKWFGKPLKE